MKKISSVGAIQDAVIKQRSANLFHQDITHEDPLLLLVTLDDRVIHLRANEAAYQWLIRNLL